MMKKIENYENVEAKGTGDFTPLKLGGHVCVIKNCYVGETTTFKEQLILELDIAEGEQKDYFQKQFDSDSRKDKKWGCIYRQLSEPENVEYFKGLITSIEKSNPGYVWNWDEKTLINKKIGGVFGLEEYINQKGEVKTLTKCVHVRSIDKVLDVGIPKVKTVDGERIDYDDYIKGQSNKDNNEKAIQKNEYGDFFL